MKIQKSSVSEICLSEINVLSRPPIGTLFFKIWDIFMDQLRPEVSSLHLEAANLILP